MPTRTEVLDRVRPVVVTATRMDAMTEERSSLGLHAPLLFHRITGELVLTWCFDWPEVRGYLDERTLEALDLDDTELSARSFDNFLSDVRTGFSTETAGGLPLHSISIGEAPRELTATALMFDELWKRLSDSAGGAPLVVGAPTRTMLLACSAAAEDAVTALALVVENAWEAATPEERLSSRLLLWDDGWSLLDDIDEDASTEP